MSGPPPDYVDVAERIRQFYERFPDGRLVTGTPPRVEVIGDRPFIWYHARAYRTPDDPFPGDGWAAEPVPGPTPFTRDSELMNAETASWGRAIVAVGFATKHIASVEEVRNRSNEDEPARDGKITQKQIGMLKGIFASLDKLQAQESGYWEAKVKAAAATKFGHAVYSLKDLTKNEASTIIEGLQKLEESERAEAKQGDFPATDGDIDTSDFVPAGAKDADDIPFGE